jgi:hypothetical protein
VNRPPSLYRVPDFVKTPTDSSVQPVPPSGLGGTACDAEKGTAGNIMPCPVAYGLLNIYKASSTTLDSLVPDSAECRTEEI